MELLEETPDGALAFVGHTTSSRERVASARAKAMAEQELILFFDSAFIEGEQIDLFRKFERLGNASTASEFNPDLLKKKWAETNRKLIADATDSLIFREKVIPDGEKFIAWQMLTIPQRWIRTHWKRSLAAADTSFYARVKRSKYFEEIKDYDIRQTDPCEGLEN